MYKIFRQGDGQFRAECQLQDGVERTVRSTEQSAVFWLIASARILNGDYITATDVEIMDDPCAATPEDRQLLDRIKRGAAVVLDATSQLIRMKLTNDELETLIALREGRAILHARRVE